MGIFKSKKSKAPQRETVKLALLIGINYTGSNLQLHGCINDVENLRLFLIKNKYFLNNEIVTMTDNQNGIFYPTKQNIIHQMNELVKFSNDDANSDKDILLFFSYSGHGYHVPDTTGDEWNGRDEVLCPVDHQKSGFIIDDYIRSQFIDKLPANVKLIGMVDACHSGTVFDLRYHYLRNGKTEINKNYLDTKCEVCLISGCGDDQTSADAWLQNKLDQKFQSQGAMTASFIYNYKDGISYNKLIKSMRQWLRQNKFNQIPELSSGRSIRINNPFLLSSYDI